jgi:hypothetical protein
LRGAIAPLPKSLPLSLIGEGDTGGEVDKNPDNCIYTGLVLYFLYIKFNI